MPIDKRVRNRLMRKTHWAVFVLRRSYVKVRKFKLLYILVGRLVNAD
ncbi:hypothetical protein SAMN04488056_11676 [Cohaesibacter marisflavi]|uniref:Uncharacterized protein n=1 Tax=Cohaesibacter marisflavi TaxID=655353 RepID=A0A1I5LBR8_9HYPH|nr:hypothetical protein SAMN04488056_11676 [Cohaesibacter marisflavi]